MSKILVIFYIFATLSVINAARVLGIFPTPSVSHQVVFRVITNELVRRGHEVVVITTDPVFTKGGAPDNLTEIDVHDISYGYLRENSIQTPVNFKYGDDTQYFETEKGMRNFFRILEVQVKFEPVQKLIREKRKFDVLLIEAYFRPALAFSHLFKAPVIQVSSFGAMYENMEAFGTSTHPMLYPIPFRSRLYNLSLWEKLLEYYQHVQYIYFQDSFKRFDDETVQQSFGTNIPSVTELTKNVDMLFLNVHPIWMGNQPVPPGIIFMGGLHQNPKKKLPQDLKTFLDSSKKGVVYVSFGTNVLPDIFPPERLKIITEALSELPYDILFKWRDGYLPGSGKNIKVSKWLPQSDLLRHPNIKAFVMQGGLQSTDEAITAGVPLVCIPMLGDQWYNAEKYEHLKIGVKLEFTTLTKSQLKDAIEKVISDDSYRQNIIKLRETMNDQPQSPLNRTIWWIEYVLRHGGAKHLRAPAAHMSWAEYYELELVLIVLTCLVVGLLTVTIIWRYISQLINTNVKIKKY